MLAFLLSRQLGCSFLDVISYSGRMRLPEKIKYTEPLSGLRCGFRLESSPTQNLSEKKKKNWQEIRTFKKVSLSNHTRKQDNKKWKHFWSCRGFSNKTCQHFINRQFGTKKLRKLARKCFKCFALKFLNIF